MSKSGLSVQEFKQVAPILFRNKVVPFLWGSQGIGKTETLKQIAKEMDAGFVHLHMANLEVGDLVGLLTKTPDGLNVFHAKPTWLPIDGDENPATGIIFLDELNRMHPDVMQAMFSFITSGTLHTHKLKSGWSIAAAGNYDNDGNFQVTDTSDSAWMSRFCHIDFKPTVEEFNLYADKMGANLIADFIREKPDMLEKNSDQKFDFTRITPDRRSWLNFIFPLEKESMDDATRYELYMGLLGPSAAAAYLSYKVTAEKTLSLKLILVDYPSQRSKVIAATQGSKTRFDYLNSPVAELLTKLKDDKEALANTKHMDNLKAFILDIPLELSQRLFKDISKLDFTGKNSLLNDMTFCQQIIDKIK